MKMRIKGKKGKRPIIKKKFRIGPKRQLNIAGFAARLAEAKKKGITRQATNE